MWPYTYIHTYYIYIHNHLLRTVPPGSADFQLGRFDCGLRQALGNITQFSISDAA